MTRYINYSGQIKSEKELKKLIKETIQLTNHKELTIFKNILKEEKEEKQRSSSFEFEDAFAEIGKKDISDKNAQDEIVKKNNITLFVLFHMFDDTFKSKWTDFYSNADLNADNQENYRQRNKKDVQDKLKIWVDAIKKAEDVNEFNEATKKLKKGIDNLFFYWEPLLIIGKNIDTFNTQIRDTLFNTLKDSNDWETATGKITYPSEKGDGKIKELLQSTDFFENNLLTNDEKKAIWKEKAESGWGSLFGGSGSDDSEGIWSWIKGLLNSAAAFFLGDDYKNVADDLFKGLGKFENMLNDKNNPEGAQNLIRGLFNLGDDKVNNKITTTKYLQQTITAISTGKAPEVIEDVSKKADQITTQNEENKNLTLETVTLKPFDSSIFTNAINEVKSKWLDNKNTEFPNKQNTTFINVDGCSDVLTIKTNEANCQEIEKNIKLINLDLYIIYTILSNSYVDSIAKSLSLNNEEPKAANDSLGKILSSITNNKQNFVKLYDNLYDTSKIGAVNDSSAQIKKVNISDFCNNLVELYNKTINIINSNQDLNWFGKYLSNDNKKKKLIMSIEGLNKENVWKDFIETKLIITLFNQEEINKKKIKEIYISVTQCISDWEDIKKKIFENFGEWLSEQK